MKQRARTDARYDTSQLTEANRGEVVHRDYLAHCLRWGWARRFVEAAGRGTARVLDVGCGRDCPLARVLNFPPGARPAYYLGVDYQAVDRAPGDRWVETLGGFDFVERWREVRDAALDEGGLFDLVVCFEVIEHMKKEDGLRLLDGLAGCVAPAGADRLAGKVLLSTPAFNGKAAAAHLHEWRVDELREAFVGAGLDVVGRYGTFASYPDIKRAADPADLALLETCRQFYSDDVAACFLAPKYPDASRNVAWVLRARR